MGRPKRPELNFALAQVAAIRFGLRGLGKNSAAHDAGIVSDLMDALKSDFEIRGKWNPQARTNVQHVRSAFGNIRGPGSRHCYGIIALKTLQ